MTNFIRFNKTPLKTNSSQIGEMNTEAIMLPTEINELLIYNEDA